MLPPLHRNLSYVLNTSYGFKFRTGTFKARVIEPVQYLKETESKK